MGTAVVAMGTCVMVVRGAAGRIMGTAAVAMGTVVVATGAATGAALFFFLESKGMLMPPQQIERQQQMPKARRNQAHQGQPPPSVDVVVAIKTDLSTGRGRGAPGQGHL